MEISLTMLPFAATITKNKEELAMIAGFVSYNPAFWCIWWNTDVLTLSCSF
jgi:hypothetical protein